MNRTVVIGSGAMAVEYAKVLKALGEPFDVVGRGAASAERFSQATGVAVAAGGLEAYLVKNAAPANAIVAVDMDQLKKVTLALLRKGVRSLLVEKPAGMNAAEIRQVAAEAKKRKAKVYVAYNRRFYSSVLKAKELIAQEGGVRSFNFEFTEWAHQIKDLDKPKEIKRSWFLGNSTHVADLAFYLGGLPSKFSSYQAGKLPWHPKASIFAGAGIAKGGALFSYQANWSSPGRWGVEVLTPVSRLIFRPLEQLHRQEIGSVAVSRVDIDDSLDQQFKPGLYLQTKAFLEKGGKGQLLELQDHSAIVSKVYSRILK